jgi:transposase
MGRARVDEEIRKMRFETLLERHERGDLSQVEAAEMLGISERTFRRWQVRLREEGTAGLADRRGSGHVRQDGGNCGAKGGHGSGGLGRRLD